MFRAVDRDGIRDALVERARAHPAVVGVALVGSAAGGREDEWSDVDLALQLAPDAEEPSVVEDWTRWIDEMFGVADHLDVFADGGGVRFRVFLLSSSLQIDVAFWPFARFRGTEDGFRLLFGDPAPPTSPEPPDPAREIALGWLYALHGRSAVERGRLWQAVTMLDHLRDQIVVLMCLRQGVESWHGRGVDLLPTSDTDALAAVRAGEVTARALADSRSGLVRLLLREAARHDPGRAEALGPALDAIADRRMP